LGARGSDQREELLAKPPTSTSHLPQSITDMSTMSEKKRKRLEQREERPAKKVAIAPPGSSKVRFKYIEEKEGLAPVLGTESSLTTFYSAQKTFRRRIY